MKSASAASRSTVLLFTWVAGSVDAITYLMAHVFTANMTGNAVLLGISAGQGRGAAAVDSFIALVGFAAGVALGALVVGESDMPSSAARIRRAVWLESFILVLFAIANLVHPWLASPVAALPLIISSGLAMGLQSAAVRRLKLPSISTTYITGTITSLFSGLVHHWRSAPTEDAAASPSEALQPGRPRDRKSSLALQAQVFISYTIAALVCGVLHARWPLAVALAPLIAIVAVDISISRRGGAAS